jgi:hypothetical protein
MKSPCQITPITILLKCHWCHPWLEIISKVGHFQGKSFRLLAVALRLFPLIDSVFSVALQKRRATPIKVKRRHLVAEMCTLETDKPTKPTCPIKALLVKYAAALNTDVYPAVDRAIEITRRQRPVSSGSSSSNNIVDGSRYVEK